MGILSFFPKNDIHKPRLKVDINKVVTVPTWNILELSSVGYVISRWFFKMVELLQI